MALVLLNPWDLATMGYTPSFAFPAPQPVSKASRDHESHKRSRRIPTTMLYSYHRNFNISPNTSSFRYHPDFSHFCPGLPASSFPGEDTRIVIQLLWGERQKQCHNDRNTHDYKPEKGNKTRRGGMNNSFRYEGGYIKVGWRRKAE